MVNGYAGKVLHVDLTAGKTWTEEPSADFYRRYVGGNGFIGYYLLKEVPKGADPLGPENALIFANGTFTGIPVAGAGRSAVGGKSPLTGGYGEADAGGFFGAESKQAGFDCIVIKGKAAKPVYLWIHDGEAEIRSAEHLWGTTTHECEEALRAELKEPRARTAIIGSAGEKMVRFACVMLDLSHSAGRTGMGAVMGSKNLKAVVARGKGTIELADGDKVKEIGRWMSQNWKDKAFGMHDLGTAGGVEGLNAIGALPTRNFQDGQFEGNAKISGRAMADTILIDRGGCYACPIRCKRVVEIKEGKFKTDPIYGGPEYETIGAFGSNCGVDDLAAISKANEICNATAADTISCGMAVSFAMECYEAGLITKKDTGGLDLSFGNAEGMVELTRMICNREGIGDLMAEGPTRAAAKLGSKALPFVVDVKGQPYPMHECRTRWGQALGYAVSPTGADHMHNFWDGAQANDPVGEGLQGLGVYESAAQTEYTTAKVRAYTVTSNWQWVHNHLGNCMFIPWSNDQIIDLVRGMTGWQTNLYELLKAGERGVTMARAFNMREGLGRKDDVLPPRMNTPHKSGVVNEKPIDPEVLDEQVTKFYGMMGWDPETGKPTLGKLQDLDIEWVADQLK
jgi:aldehyde:ferredoxin oxidoreductase